MVRRCSVPGCNGNYKRGPKVSTFRFPASEFEKEAWIAAIKTVFSDITVNERSRVCELHFEPDDILRKTSSYDSVTGKTITTPLHKPKLKPGIVPYIFPERPPTPKMVWYGSCEQLQSLKGLSEMINNVESKSSEDESDDDLENSYDLEVELDILEKEKQNLEQILLEKEKEEKRMSSIQRLTEVKNVVDRALEELNTSHSYQEKTFQATIQDLQSKILNLKSRQ